MSTLKLIIDAYIQNPGKESFRGNILMENAKIVDITADVSADALIIDAKGCTVTPGLIDQHLHGGYGCDFNTAETAQITDFLVKLPLHGVTTICPTIMTDTLENIKRQINKIKQAKRALPVGAAKILGINLEGPFLNPNCRGAHPEELILPPTVANYKLIEDEEIKIITISPELDENLELVKYLTEKGVIVSAGHTGAENLYGLKHVTHLFNAMSPLHHRNPGVVGSSLVDDKVYVEVIADHQHLHPDILQLILKSKPSSKVIFVSDSLPLNLSGQGSMMFGGQEIFKQGEIAVNKSGKFAGSLFFLDSIFRINLGSGKHPTELLQFCSLNPANNLGLKNNGLVEIGMDADLVVWDENYNVKMSFVDGICLK